MKKLLAFALAATIAISGTTIKSHAYTPLYHPVSIKIPTITKVNLPDAVAEAAREAGAEAAKKVIKCNPEPKEKGNKESRE